LHELSICSSVGLARIVDLFLGRIGVVLATSALELKDQPVNLVIPSRAA
jgi:hypothetical protein